jgi:hypothetical protein
MWKQTNFRKDIYVGGDTLFEEWYEYVKHNKRRIRYHMKVEYWVFPMNPDIKISNIVITTSRRENVFGPNIDQALTYLKRRGIKEVPQSRVFERRD